MNQLYCYHVLLLYNNHVFQKKTIGIIKFPNSRIITPKNSYNITYKFLSIKEPEKIIKPSYGYYLSLFHHNYYDLKMKNIYKFEEYSEDMLMNTYMDYYKHQNLKNYDLLFIPNFGLKFDNSFNKKLSRYIDTLHIDNKTCLIKLFMNSDEREKNLSVNEGWFIPEWLNKSSKGLGGILIPPHVLEAIYIMNVYMHHLNRVDLLIEHYCEINKMKVFVPEFNIVDIPNNIYN